MSTYGCHNRLPFKDGLWVQDGHVHEERSQAWVRLPRIVKIDSRMSRECKFDLRATDPRCAGCSWVNTTSKENTNDDHGQ